MLFTSSKIREIYMTFSIKGLKAVAVGAVLVTGLATAAVAQDLKFFTIGTGGTAYTYYPVGGVIANAISKPPGSRECDAGGSCGVEGFWLSSDSGHPCMMQHRSHWAHCGP